MSARLIGSLAAGCVGLGTYLVLSRNDTPGPGAQPVRVVATPAPPASPPPPAVLPGVIDVTDLDPLLDPPEKPAGGVPFDAAPATPAAAAPAPQRIPPAAD